MAMTNKEFSSHFSDTFTPEIKSFGRETLLKEGFDCLIVTDKEDKEKAYCTHCRKWVKIPGDNLHTGSPRNAWRREREESCYCHSGYAMIPEAELQRRKDIKARKEKTCPECGYTFNVYHQWRMDMSQLDGTVSISVFDKSKVQPDAVVLRRIEINREYGNDAAHVVKDTFEEAERYLFRMGHKTVRQKCHYLETKYKNGKWSSRYVRKFVKSIRDSAFRQSNFAYYDHIEGHYRMNIGTLMRAIQDTPYQYLFQGGERNYLNHYDKYEFRVSYPLYTVNYMDLYSLHPWIELLIKNGMDNLVIDHIRGKGSKGGISWAAKNIKSAVKRFTKQDLKDVMEHNSQQLSMGSHVDETTLSVLAFVREKIDPQMTLKQAIQIAREGYGQLETMYAKAERLGLSGRKVMEYSLKEGGLGHAIGDWLDYIRDAKKVGLDLRDKRNSMPKDLKRRHANIIKQIRYRENKELEEKLKATLALRNKIFCWKGKKYFIRPAESTKELIAEGKTLHHCVGGYAERHAKGETTILLVRENDNPDKPLYTMEVKGSVKEGWRMVQIRGNMNADPPAEVKKIVKQFMEQVNAKGKEGKVRKTA